MTQFFSTDPETTPETPNPPGVPKELPVHMVIKELCGDLARNLHTQGNDISVLGEQVHLLNALFNATLAEQLNLSHQQYGESRAQGWLELALKIQKQCMDTVRTRQSAEYMESLRDLNTIKIHTRPSSHASQTAPLARS